ncbi:MAG: hypothetical protein Q8Q01_00900 [archaeon]|nr:hypothetical protein [archaeon]
MDQQIIFKLINLDTLNVTKEEKADIHGVLIKLSYEINPSTSDLNIKNNIKVIEEIEKFLLTVQEKHKADFKKAIEFFRYYKSTNILHRSIPEDNGIEDPFLQSVIAKNTQNSIIKVSEPLNYEQVKNLARLVFEDTQNKPLIFTISNKHRIEGKVIGEIEQRKIKLPVAWKAEISPKEDSDKKTYVAYIFGQKIPKRTKIIDEISGEFYLYRFLSKDTKEYVLISTEKLNLDDYTVHGLSIEVEDTKIIGDAYRLLNKFPVFFVHTANSHICTLTNHKELFAKCDEIKLTGNKLYEYLQSHKTAEGIKILEHPRWFLKFIAAFLFHKKKGITSAYPMHLLWIADRGTGKSSFLEALHQKSGESQEIVAGSSSTLKYLIPSFKEQNRPEMGALAKASRLVIVDEFFRILRLNINEKEDECGRMNDLLEHKDRQAGSGQGRIRTSMTARLMATTNPIAGTNNIVSLVDKFDDSFLSRFLIYYQTDDHVKFIHQKMKEDTLITKEWIEVNDFLSIQDYLQSFDSQYKRERLVKLCDKFVPFLSETVRGLYEARYLHHLECLLDGIVKVRCLSTRDSNFTAIEEDYQEAEFVWSIIIKSWFKQTIDELLKDQKIPLEMRSKFIPEEGIYILRTLANLGFKATPTALKEKCRLEMHQTRLHFNLSLLVQGGFIIEKNDLLYHYEWAEVEKI